MSPAPTSAEFNEEEALHYRAVLRTLVDIAMAEATSIQAEQFEPGATTLDRSIRFERIARTIRRCILLARKLAEPLPTPRQAPVREPTRREREDATALQATSLDPPDRPDRLDRLDPPERVDDLSRRPIYEIVAEIAHGLGIAPAQTQSLRFQPGASKANQTESLDAAIPLPKQDNPAGSAFMLLERPRPPNKPDLHPPRR